MKKDTQTYITEFLKLIGEKIPMDPAKPNLTINENGELILSVIIGQHWYAWIFDEEFEKSPQELADYIVLEYAKGGLLIPFK